MGQLKNSVFVIAEAGVNHNGQEKMAFELVDAAVRAGADAVKFQTFNSEALATKNSAKAAYQLQTTSTEESQLAMLKRLELSYELHHDLIAYCNKNNIQFLSTAFDLESLRFLANDLGLTTLKIPSGEITNAPLVLEYARTKADLILSTGMATLAEIEAALGVIAYGLLSKVNSDLQPSKALFYEAYCSEEGQNILQEKVTLLHCTTEYPAPYEDINLRTMETLKIAFGLKTGYSDHSTGITVPIAAASLGACLIEKHFTLSKELEGPDHKASLEPDELKAMVDAIHIVDKVLGDGRKLPRNSEILNRAIVRKSIVANTDIKKGDFFSSENLSVKRPGHGISPMEYWDLLNQRSTKDYHQDEIIT